ncbi:uncharacterized protein LOC143593648 [Bidens hawaiensis]|uniref:uncharacterized protein LOC143593648 n=1 Tax=Bidens hawaiensis TaxID=980011 RepID=UPI00404A6B1E
MPKYAKFWKDLLKRKDRLQEISSIPLSVDCSAIVLNRVPEKLSDPGVYTIPCSFRSDMMSRVLADLGVSINLMPYSLYEKLDLGELTPTRISLSLADRSVKYPRVLDMEANEKVPIILGPPFLRTAKALIDVYEGRITLRVGDENCLDYICGTDLVGMDVDEELTEIIEDSKEEVVDDVSCLAEIMEVSEIICEKEAEKPAPLELKVLPSHLEYAYLEEGSNLPVIVSSKLSKEEKSKLIEDVEEVHRNEVTVELGKVSPYGDRRDSVGS